MGLIRPWARAIVAACLSVQGRDEAMGVVTCWPQLLLVPCPRPATDRLLMNLGISWDSRYGLVDANHDRERDQAEAERDIGFVVFRGLWVGDWERGDERDCVGRGRAGDADTMRARR
ncbi:hypothetical protein BDV11DRAFT_193762 [Aspergillus similis]